MLKTNYLLIQILDTFPYLVTLLVVFIYAPEGIVFYLTKIMLDLMSTPGSKILLRQKE